MIRLSEMDLMLARTVLPALTKPVILPMAPCEMGTPAEQAAYARWLGDYPHVEEILDELMADLDRGCHPCAR